MKETTKDSHDFGNTPNPEKRESKKRSHKKKGGGKGFIEELRG